MMSNDHRPTGHMSANQKDETPEESYAGIDTLSEEQYIGKKLLDHYEMFKSPLEGGFGIVYFVTDTETNQDYAVKTYKPELANQLLGVEQFKAEIDFWLNLGPYPHIVKAYCVETLHNQPYLFMEYVDGGSSGSNLRDRLKTAGGQLRLDQAIEFAYQLCLGMEFANRKGEIVHSDLKPENIMIDRNNIVKVTDFGTAELIRVVDGKYPRIERSTWEYAAPELFDDQAADSRSDIFSFGIILWEMLMGENNYPYPFKLSSNRKELRNQLATFHNRHGMHDLNQNIYYHGIPGFSKDISDIVCGCLSDDMSDRFRNFTELRKPFEHYFNLKPPVANNQATSEDLHQHALSLHRIGRFKDALTLFNRLLVQHPDDGQIWLDAAETLQAVGDEETAQMFRERAFYFHPELMREK